MTTMVYVACAEPREIVRFAMDRDSGVLRQVDTTYVPGIEQPASTSMPLAVSPDKRVLHAALRGVPYPGVEFRDRAGWWVVGDGRGESAASDLLPDGGSDRAAYASPRRIRARCWRASNWMHVGR